MIGILNKEEKDHERINKNNIEKIMYILSYF